jgi:subtilase family serine protease
MPGLLHILCFSIFIYVAVSASTKTAQLPRAHDRIHEFKWKKTSTPDPQHLVSLTVALKQRNVEKLEKLVEYVSHPHSAGYGKYFSLDQIRELVQPEEKVITVSTFFHLTSPSSNSQKVRQWLSLFATKIHVVQTRDFIVVESTVEKVEKFFGIRIRHHHHANSGTRVVFCFVCLLFLLLFVLL